MEDFDSLLSTSSSSSDEDLLGAGASAGGSGLGGIGGGLRRTKPARRAPPRTIVGSRTWVIGERIGSGASSVVRAGIDVTSLQMAAVKVLDMRKLRRSRGAVERVRGEIRILRALKHTNVVALRDVVDDKKKQRMYLVLEMVNGSSLQDLIQKEGCGDGPTQGRALPPGQVAYYTAQALKALNYVHGRGFVHRDVKPANLLVSASGAVKLTDFGVAEEISRYTSDDSVSKTLGSPAFQAPEIATGKDAFSGTKVDVWALGVTVYYLLTGQVPFHADSHLALFKCIAKGEYSYPSVSATATASESQVEAQEREEVPDEAKDCIAKMLVVDYEQRWSVDQLLKHPWIGNGMKNTSAKLQAELGWVQVTARNFNVLELCNRFLQQNEAQFDDDEDDQFDGDVGGDVGVLTNAFRLL